MSATIDHAGIPAADPQASARFLAAILAEGEVTPEGPDGEMTRLGVRDSTLTWFALGGAPRIYFHDPNGHLFELFVPAGQSR